MATRGEAVTELDAQRHLLERLAERLGLEVRYEAMAFDRPSSSAGGLCRLHQRPTIFVDRNAPRAEQVGVLLDALGQMDVDCLFVPPAIRRELARRYR